MNKKGQTAIIALIISLIAGAVIVGNVLTATISGTTDAQTDSDVIEHISGAGNTTQTLEKASDGLSLETSSLTIPGLTAGSNYTISYTTGLVTIENQTATANYTATYGYYESNYLEDSSDRALMDLVTLFAIIGLVVTLGRGFGLI